METNAPSNDYSLALENSEKILKKLDDLAGMDLIRDLVRKLVNLAIIRRRDGKVPAGPHILLTGNPGTGKTVLARTLGQAFASAGMLSTGQLVEVTRTDLISPYAGQTPSLVQKCCDAAMGGVLFIDDAYQLRQNDHDSFGQEAVNTLMKRMEDDRGKLIVILSGYHVQMENFINAHPGIRSRITDECHLPDYTPGQLVLILKGFIKNGGFSLDEKAEEKAAEALKEMYDEGREGAFANGRAVRHFYEAIVMNRAKRLADAPGDPGLIIPAEDIP